jgi:1-acyl-sn-glycerol-3-phosphate acyltransferase
LIYDVLQVLIRLILRVFLRVDVEGRANVPEGGFLVVSNHLSWTDTVFILYALPRRPRLHTLANESTVFNTRFKRWLMPRVAVFPIRRNRGMLDEAAVEGVYELLNSGERVLIFPEGAYGKDGQLRPLKDGVGYFAINSGKPLLPVSLSRTDRLRPFGRVSVVIGKPFIPDPPRTWQLKQRVAAAVAAVRTSLSRLSRPPSGRRRRWIRWPRRRARPGGSARGDPPQVAGVEGAEAVIEEQQAQSQQEQADGQSAQGSEGPHAIAAEVAEGGPEHPPEST